MTRRIAQLDPSPEATRSHREHLTAGYGEWAERLVAQGFVAYLLTFMFDPLSGSPAAVLAAMEREVVRAYVAHVTRVVRKPTAPSSWGRLPVWLCSPDFPVFKHVRQRLADVAVNGGAHVHAVAFDPPWSRLRQDLVEHFERHRAVYVHARYPLRTIDVEPITHDLAYVVDYGRKSVTRGRVGEDAMLVLPRTLEELRG